MRIILMLGLALCEACSQTATTDSSEAGQQVGDVVASIDESGGGGGSLSGTVGRFDSFGVERLFSRLAPRGWWELSFAAAATCGASSTFSSCSANVVTRTFAGCTIGAGTFSGSVTLTFDDDNDSDNTCRVQSVGESVTRAPNFTVTGLRGATLAVTKTGTVGQRLTKTAANTFAFSNDGIRRVFTKSSGAVSFDFTTRTTADITVTGTSRNDRVLNGGGLRVINNLKDSYCDLVAEEVAWETACNCPVSGTFSGTCSDGKSFSLNFTDCGAASITVGSVTTDVDLDRCYSTI